jgi:thioredoxin reductase (NADPH)
MMPEDRYEVLVIGGGPAGLSAALYLARYNRRTALFDSGHGRSSWHQTNHNYLGFPGGIAARDLRELGRKQLADYPQVTIFDYKIEAVRRAVAGFLVVGQAGEWWGQTLIICTGVVDHYPHFDGWEDYVGRSMFWCITCDGYNSKGSRVVVLGNTNEAGSEALQLQRFTQQLTVLTNSHENTISEKFRARLDRAGIPLIHDKIERVVGSNGRFEALYTMGGRRIELDQLFNQQGATPVSELAADLGVALNELGYILTDTEQKTNVPGVYAAGDVTRLFSHQVSTAVHEGGQAASAANYYLYPPELKDE